MLKARVIEPSSSLFLNPLVVVAKANGDRRICLDFRRLNANTKLTGATGALPTMNDIIEQIADQKPIYFSSLALFSGDHQIPMDRETSDRTAFKCKSGIFEYVTLPFGLSNTVNGFCERIVGVLGKMASTCTTLASSHDEMISHLSQVFSAFRSARLKINPKKCHFSTDRLVFLGQVF